MRRLAGCDSVLNVSAMLGLASSTESAVCAPATYWRMTPQGFFTATALKPNEHPLASQPLGRLTFHEAVELWRPIALSVQQNHSKGLVHGHITPWGVWSDGQRLFLHDGGTWLGDAIPALSWWPDSMRASQSLRRTATIQDDLSNLARLLILLHNGGSPEDEPRVDTLPAWASAPLVGALERKGNIARVADLLTALAPPPPHGMPMPADDRESMTVLYGRTSHVEPIHHPQKGDGIRFWLTHPAYNADGKLRDFAPPQGAFFYRGAHGEVFESIAHVWEGAEINILDAFTVTDSQGRTFLTARPETLPVIEPHWPVTVTNVLKAEGCVSRFLVDNRQDELPNKHLVFGSLIHEFLERTGSVPDASFERLWARLVPRYRIGILAAGLGDVDMDAFQEDAEKHYRNILGFSRGHERRVGDQTRQTWTGENVEVSRYSSIYGLEGRIDLVTEDEKHGLHIVELKTGSAREEHLTQVRSYKLLWDPLAEKQHAPISGYLLYSRDALLRSTPLEDPLRERRILRARNALVAYHHSAAHSARIVPQFHMEIPAECNSRVCKFRKSTCARQTAILGFGQEAPDPKVWGKIDPDLIARGQRWWAHFNRLIELESWVDTQALGMMLQTGRLRERIEGFRAVDQITLENVDMTSGRVVFSGDHRGIFHLQDTVIAHHNDFHGSHIIRGTVVHMEPNRLEVMSSGMPHAKNLNPQGWTLDVLPMRIGYRAAQKAIFKIMDQQRPDLFEVLFRPGSEKAKTLFTVESPQHTDPLLDLNQSQHRALQAGLHAPLGCLIQGPPGTGKTTIIAHLVHALVRQGNSVLLAAQTNTAVDTMLGRTLEVGTLRFLRAGKPDRNIWLSERLRQLGEDPDTYFSDSLAEITPSLDSLRRRILESPVVGVTAYGAAGSDLMHIFERARGPMPFDVVIVDEATQLTEPMVHAAISRAKRFILVGDHRQLPPVVRHEGLVTPFHESFNTQEYEVKSAQMSLFQALSTPTEPTDDMSLHGLDQSLFERLVECGLPYTMLTEQYRSHQDIMAFSNRQFYDNALKPHASVATRTLEFDQTFEDPTLQTICEPSRPVVFVNVSPRETSESRSNLDEAQAALKIIQSLIDGGIKPSQIGVITPFRAQVHLIRSTLFSAQIPDVDVDTVERYQGSERDVILVSFVKTERAGEFISDPRRLNVTLTRARRKLIILAHFGCLHLDPLMRELLEQPETHHVLWDVDITH